MALKDVNGFHPLEVFLHPKQTVQNSLDHPSIIIAVILVLLPWIVSFITTAVTGLNGSFSAQAARMAVGVAVFFIEVWLVFIIAKGFGNKERKLFEGVASSFALVQLVSLVLAVFSLIVLVLSPQVTVLMNDWNAGKIQQSDLTIGAWNALMANFALGIIIIVVGIILVVWIGFLILYLNFLTIHQSTKSSVFISIILMLVIFLVGSFLSNILGSLLAVV